MHDYRYMIRTPRELKDAFDRAVAAHEPERTSSGVMRDMMRAYVRDHPVDETAETADGEASS